MWESGLRSLWGRIPDALAVGELLIRGRGRAHGAVVLAYHDITDYPESFTSYAVSTGRFRQHIELARRWGYTFVDLATIVDRAERPGDLDGLAAVVFDDCLAGVYRNALPVLVELGVPATLFAVTRALGTVPGWWPGSSRVMTNSELLEMSDVGCRLGSHTRSHLSLPSVGDGSLGDEVSGSRQDLEDRIQERVDLFAYPFGHHDPRVRDAVAKSGYRAAFSFLNGRVSTGLDPLRLPRINMHEGLATIRFAHHLARSAQRWPDTQLESVGDAGTGVGAAHVSLDEISGSGAES
ncbi:MAG: polysaccharide deacetylase family protein [Actinomycetota bacterium]|nr:polysaccharide deacetylase family protein [Actinomycetota bacterium]